MFIKYLFPKIHITIEKWKYNKNYRLYVSNLGNFKDSNKKDIIPKVEKGGYLAIALCNNKKGIVRNVFAHRIVMETWYPRPDMWKERLTVDHKDHNKRNNRCDNLEWVTAKENYERASRDFLDDDKDRLIQSLQDKIRLFETTSNNEEGYIIAAVGIKRFKNWNEVKQFLATKNPDYVNIKNIRMANRILTACKNNTKYMNYYWKQL